MRKIKAVEDSSEYCLIEHLEFEQQQQQQQQPKSSLSTSDQLTTSQTTNSKLIVKTRVLELTENLFVLTHVWNKMMNEKKDGFKMAKVKLTKKKCIQGRFYSPSFKSQIANAINSTGDFLASSAQPTLSTVTTSTMKPLKQRVMSLQPSKNTNNGSNLSELSTPSPSHQQVNNLIVKQSKASILNVPPTGSQVNSRRSLAVHQKRARSSLNRLVRQKSFDEDTANAVLNENESNENCSIEKNDKTESIICLSSSLQMNEELSHMDKQNTQMEKKTSILIESLNEIAKPLATSSLAPSINSHSPAQSQEKVLSTPPPAPPLPPSFSLGTSQISKQSIKNNREKSTKNEAEKFLSIISSPKKSQGIEATLALSTEICLEKDKLDNLEDNDDDDVYDVEDEQNEELDDYDYDDEDYNKGYQSIDKMTVLLNGNSEANTEQCGGRKIAAKAEAEDDLDDDAEIIRKEDNEGDEKTHNENNNKRAENQQGSSTLQSTFQRFLKLKF